jgi:hypothetical protein
VRAVFDGDPFPGDNGLPDGQKTPHDRALALIKVALVNLDRMLFDAKSGALCDSAQLGPQGIVRSSHTTTVEAVYALVALRAAYRAITSQLTLYSDSTPDRAALNSALDGTSMAGAPAGAGVIARLQQLMQAQADFLDQKLVGADGLAINGFDLAAGAADAAPTTLDAQAAAVRGLLEAYLITSNTAYRTRAQQAYAVLEQRFYHPTYRLYRPYPGEENTFVFTPTRFGAVQSALRQMYILVAAAPGNDTLRAELEARLGRLNKLVLNGWDDRNGNDQIDYPDECLGSTNKIGRGGLQMSERALTGDIGLYRQSPFPDFDGDCMPNLAYAKLPALLAAELRISPAQ